MFISRWVANGGSMLFASSSSRSISLVAAVAATAAAVAVAVAVAVTVAAAVDWMGGRRDESGVVRRDYHR